MNANDLWIKVNRRDLTPEEEKTLREKYEIDADDEYYMFAFDNLMPNNGQRIIVTQRGNAAFPTEVTSTDYCQFDGAIYKLKFLGSWDNVTAWQPYPSPYTVETHKTPVNAPESVKGIELSSKEHNALYRASDVLVAISERMTEQGIKELKYGEPHALPKNYSAGMIQGIARSLYEIEKAKEGGK